MQNDDVQETIKPIPPRRNGARYFGLGLTIFLMAAAFFSGFHVGTEGRMQAGLSSLFAQQVDTPKDGVDLSEFWRVWNLLENKFVSGTTTENLSDLDRVRGAIDGLVGSYGDPYTVYLPPVEAAAFEEDISGNFGGVGMEVGMRDNMVTVIAPLPDTPAERAGLIAGDKVVKIDGKSTDDMTIDAAVKLIRGEVGTDVVLTIYREGETEFRDITITRGLIDIPTIDTEVRDDVFIISLYSFNALSEPKMQEALREYMQSGKTKLIVDLRDNPGGFLQSAVSIASYFLPAGRVVVEENFGGEREDVLYRSSGKELRDFTPEDVVVLVNRGSASASEILAGALKAHSKATVMGETTFGKGSVQELVELDDGASLKVTVARWLTPDGTSISEGGLDPDIEVVRTPQMVMDGEDPQLTAAIEFLSGIYVSPEPEMAEIE